MDEWVVWLIAAVVFAVGEVLTLGFFLAPFALGAVVAMLLSALGAGTVLAGAAFVAVATAALFGLRPIAVRHRHQPARLRTGTAALIGRSAVVVERVSDGG